MAISPQALAGSATIAGNVTVVQPTGTNLHAVIDSGSVNIGSVTTLPAITGAVTANAGTNLNTSALALESGGNLASIVTSVTNVPNIIGTAGLAIPSKLIQVGGSDGTNARAVKVDTTGNLNTNLFIGGATVSTTNPVAVQPPASGHLHVDGDGVAGTPAAGVVTVQGITSMTPVQVSQATASNLNATVVGTGTFAVQATLAAETTKVIGTVNQGTSPWIAAGGGIAGTAATGVVTVQGIAGMTKLLVTPDSVALPANQSVNVAQIAGNTTITGGANGLLGVGGQTATNVAITDNPVNLGAQAVSSENAAVTTARKVQLVADLVGKLITLPYANPENFVSGAITTAMTGTTSTSLVAAPAGSLRNYITTIIVSNSHATVGTDIIIQDGLNGTTLCTIPAAPAYGGAVVTFPTPLRQPTAATALYCANVTTGSSTKASAFGYKGL